MYWTIVYSASDVDIPKDDRLKFSGSVVRTLMSKHLGKNDILYTDNFYTSPTISQYLLEQKT